MTAAVLRRWAGLLVAAVLAGCAPSAQITLLPQAQGTSAVEVRTRTATTVLSTPYAQAAVQPDGQVQTVQRDAAQVQARYGQLLSVQPAADQHFTLYFESGGTVLTAESQATLETILEQATQRPGGAIVVTGHTDRVGTVPANDALSLQRAQSIRELLIAKGFDARRVEAVGRGEREPAVATDDEVAESRNRRTTIIVR